MIWSDAAAPERVNILCDTWGRDTLQFNRELQPHTGYQTDAVTELASYQTNWKSVTLIADRSFCTRR